MIYLNEVMLIAERRVGGGKSDKLIVVGLFVPVAVGVVFPCVCLPSSAAELQQSVPEQSVKVAENPQKYVMKFKTAEIYEEIKQYFKVKSKK